MTYARTLAAMSTAAEDIFSLSFEEYLEREVPAEQRHEYVGGRVYLMAGGTERHDLAAGLVYEALAPGARAQGCRPFMSNRLLRTTSAAYYPDVLVVCSPAGHRLYETDATVVVEVLSRSTQASDRREKATQYGQLPGLGLYLLVDPDERRIEVAVADRGALAWQVFGPGAVVPTRYGDLDVDALYDQLDASAST